MEYSSNKKVRLPGISFDFDNSDNSDDDVDNSCSLQENNNSNTVEQNRANIIEEMKSMGFQGATTILSSNNISIPQQQQQHSQPTEVASDDDDNNSQSTSSERLLTNPPSSSNRLLLLLSLLSNAEVAVLRHLPSKLGNGMRISSNSCSPITTLTNEEIAASSNAVIGSALPLPLLLPNTPPKALALTPNAVKTNANPVAKATVGNNVFLSCRSLAALVI